jgi:hypothetical protein
MPKTHTASNLKKLKKSNFENMNLDLKKKGIRSNRIKELQKMSKK